MLPDDEHEAALTAEEEEAEEGELANAFDEASAVSCALPFTRSSLPSPPASRPLPTPANHPVGVHRLFSRWRGSRRRAPARRVCNATPHA